MGFMCFCEVLIIWVLNLNIYYVFIYSHSNCNRRRPRIALCTGLCLVWVRDRDAESWIRASYRNWNLLKDHSIACAASVVTSRLCNPLFWLAERRTSETEGGGDKCWDFTPPRFPSEAFGSAAVRELLSWSGNLIEELDRFRPYLYNFTPGLAFYCVICRGSLVTMRTM